MPRPPTRTDDALLDALLEVFRAEGFEGASLSRIASATGLQRASLYHRFPGGKDEMALAVLRRVHRRFAEEILAPLGEPGSPAARVKRTAKRLEEFYRCGEESCLLDTLTLGQPTAEMRAAVRESIEAVTGAFAAVARECGHSPAGARRLGQDALVRIEGALVLARGTGDTGAFKRVLRELPALLCGDA